MAIEEGKKAPAFKLEDASGQRVSLADFEQMVLAGEIRDAPTLSAYALLKIKNIIP